jgi:hypothetical protein
MIRGPSAILVDKAILMKKKSNGRPDNRDSQNVNNNKKYCITTCYLYLNSRNDRYCKEKRKGKCGL